MIASFLKYAWRAKGPHGIHSPFVFDLARKGLKAPLPNTVDDIKNLRKQLAKDQVPVSNTFGTNSGAFPGKGTMADLVKKASIPSRYGALLYRLAAHYQPSTILELGSCIGFSTAYLAATGIPVTTVEGNANFAALTRRHLTDLGLSNVAVINATFQDFIDTDVPQLPFIPFLYLDGDHSYEATMKYFNQLLPTARDESIWVFDDIYWSKGMREAWQEIQQHPRVGFSLDFFKFGVVSFKPMIQKQHFYIWY